MGARDPDGVSITIIGSGTAVPEPDRVCSAYFVDLGAARVLLDCGSGAVHHLARFRVDWQRLTHVALTHFHNDHIGDLPMLFFALKHGMMPPRRDPLTVIGPPGMAQRMSLLADALGDHVHDPGFPVDIVEQDSGEVTLGDGGRLTVTRTRHTEESIAYRFDTRAGSFAYTGDTGYDEALAAAIAGVDVLLMECALPEEYAIDAHLTPARAARMATAIGPALLVVTHVYPLLDRDRVPQMIADAGWRGVTRMARDGLRLSLPLQVSEAAG